MTMTALRDLLHRRGLMLFRIGVTAFLLVGLGLVAWQVWAPRDQVLLPTVDRRSGISSADVSALLKRVTAIREPYAPPSVDPFATSLDNTLLTP